MLCSLGLALTPLQDQLLSGFLASQGNDQPGLPWWPQKPLIQTRLTIVLPNPSSLPFFLGSQLKVGIHTTH